MHTVICMYRYSFSGELWEMVMHAMQNCFRDCRQWAFDSVQEMNGGEVGNCEKAPQIVVYS